MPHSEALAWLRTQAEGTDDNAGHARAVLAMVEDSARMDWLEAQTLMSIGGMHEGDDRSYSVLAGEGAQPALEGDASSLRGAIDAARATDAPAPSHQRDVLGRRP